MNIFSHNKLDYNCKELSEMLSVRNLKHLQGSPFPGVTFLETLLDSFSLDNNVTNITFPQ